MRLALWELVPLEHDWRLRGHRLQVDGQITGALAMRLCLAACAGAAHLPSAMRALRVRGRQGLVCGLPMSSEAGRALPCAPPLEVLLNLLRV